MSISQAETVETIISAISGKGVGRYAITYPPGSKMSITFSFSVWQGESEPFVGQPVFLSGIVKNDKGLRANKAYPLSLAREE